MQVFITHRWQKSECNYLIKCDLIELQRVTRSCVTSLQKWNGRINRKPSSSMEERVRPQTGEMDGKITKNWIVQSNNMVTQEAAGNQSLNLKHHFTTEMVTSPNGENKSWQSHVQVCCWGPETASLLALSYTLHCSIWTSEHIVRVCACVWGSRTILWVGAPPTHMIIPFQSFK